MTNLSLVQIISSFLERKCKEKSALTLSQPVRLLTRELTQHLTTADDAIPPADECCQTADGKPPALRCASPTSPVRPFPDLRRSVLRGLHPAAAAAAPPRLLRRSALPRAPPSVWAAVVRGPSALPRHSTSPQRLVLSTIPHLPSSLLSPYPSHSQTYPSSNQTQCGHEIPPLVELPKHHRRRLIPQTPPLHLSRASPSSPSPFSSSRCCPPPCPQPWTFEVGSRDP